MIQEDNLIEKAIIVAVKTGHTKDFESFMKALERLVLALGLEVAGKLCQELPAPNPATYIGSGKLEELSSYAGMLEADYVIFADTLSPSQLKNITRGVDVVVFDRVGLILEIFKRRARTKESRLQVEMANLQYMLPRLVGMKTSLGRQAGTSGSLSNRGQGEKQIELDRRHIEKRISELRAALEDIEQNRDVQRKARKKGNIPLVALVGYTNAGKSSLMNCLLNRGEGSGEKLVFEKDMLFATLDEVKYADLLLIVADVSDPDNKAQIQVTIDTLKEIGCDTLPRMLVYNKADLIDIYPKGYDKHNERIYISAKDNTGIEDLIDAIKGRVYSNNEILKI